MFTFGKKNVDFDDFFDHTINFVAAGNDDRFLSLANRTRDNKFMGFGVKVAILTTKIRFWGVKVQF